MQKLLNPVCSVIFQGFIGACLGLVAGLVIGFFLWSSYWIIMNISEAIQSIQNAPYYAPRLRDTLHLTISFGSLVGAVFGSLVGLKSLNFNNEKPKAAKK